MINQNKTEKKNTKREKRQMKFECRKVKINKRNTIFWSLIAKHIAKCGHIGILPAVDAAAFVMKKTKTIISATQVY